MDFLINVDGLGTSWLAKLKWDVGLDGVVDLMGLGIFKGVIVASVEELRLSFSNIWKGFLKTGCGYVFFGDRSKLNDETDLGAVEVVAQL